MNYIATANAAQCQYTNTQDACVDNLAFTGLDVGFILVVAVLLILVGLAIRARKDRRA